MARFAGAGTSRANGVSDHVTIGVRGSNKAGRNRRSGRSKTLPFAAVTFVLSLILSVTVFVYYFLSVEVSDKVNTYGTNDDDIDFLGNVTRTKTYKVLEFGKGSVVHGRDSRYWDKDDRRRDDDYNEDVVADRDEGSSDNGDDSVKVKSFEKKARKGLEGKGIGLYNEAGRNELKAYEAEYEASLRNLRNPLKEEEDDPQNLQLEDEDLENRRDLIGTADEYNDGKDYLNNREDDSDEAGRGKEEKSDIVEPHYKEGNIGQKDENVSTKSKEKELIEKSQNVDEADRKSKDVHVVDVQSSKKSKTESKKKGKRHKFSGSCDIKFLDNTAQLIEPLESRKFARFSLQYTDMEDKPDTLQPWEPRFAGHQSWEEREDSFVARDQSINCGFIKGPKGTPSTGFDLAEDDVNYISRCHIAVISCIFGNSDRLRTPTGRSVTRMSRKMVCFVMFVDEITFQMLTSEGQTPDGMGFIGLWKIVVVKNMPFTDMRRVGKIPKLLPHRLFPSARYSIWLDSKLRLQLDPLRILEYFLWRKGQEYAISNHYDRHCVWEEVMQNKRLNKYNHTVIDEQFEFYQADGLTRFNASDPNKLLPSNVPEGSFIIRAHTPMSNLFSCLWFNEVDRFTPRDQLSFAYTYMKLRRTNPGKPFHLNMFRDCERRAIAKLYHHRSEERRNILPQETE